MTGERKLRRNGQVETTSTASPEAVWAIVSDVTRIGEWSHECLEASLLDGATAPAPGVRFQGTEHGRARAVGADQRDGARRRAARVLVAHGADTDVSRQHRVDDLDRTGRGRRMPHHAAFEVLKLNPIMDRLIWLVTPAHRDRLPALEADLVRLAEAAAAAVNRRRDRKRCNVRARRRVAPGAVR